MHQPIVAICALLAAASLLGAKDSDKKEENPSENAIVTVVPPDAIRPITKPTFLTRAQAEPQMRDAEPVLGLIDPATGQAKAYSLWHLEWHEVVNDRLGDNPIAVTW